MLLNRLRRLLVLLEAGLAVGSECEGQYSCRLDSNLVDQFSRTESLTECHLHCLAAPDCQVYSLNTELEVCTLLSSCLTPDLSCSHCITAHKYCPGELQFFI